METQHKIILAAFSLFLILITIKSALSSDGELTTGYGGDDQLLFTWQGGDTETYFETSNLVEPTPQGSGQAAAGGGKGGRGGGENITNVTQDEISLFLIPASLERTVIRFPYQSVGWVYLFRSENVTGCSLSEGPFSCEVDGNSIYVTFAPQENVFTQDYYATLTVNTFQRQLSAPIHIQYVNLDWYYPTRTSAFAIPAFSEITSTGSVKGIKLVPLAVIGIILFLVIRRIFFKK